MSSSGTTSGNTVVGSESFISGSGNNNSVLGYSAMHAAGAGDNNIAIGDFSLYYNSGDFNIAIGSYTLLGNSTGDYNTATGAGAMGLNQTGSYNSAYGNGAMAWADRGNYNTAQGFESLFGNQGNFNTAIGASAMRGNGEGSYNTAVGYEANVASFSLSNAMAIGAGAVVDASNKVRIGNSAVTVIEGQVPFTTPSDGRFKFNVEEDVKGLDFILQLRPVTYQFDVKRFDENSGGNVSSNNDLQKSYDEAAQIRRSGFIAQEVERAALKSAYNFSGLIRPQSIKDHYSLSYDAFVVPLVKAVQEQQKIILALERKMADQDKINRDLQTQLDELKKMLHH
jgi:hypothetical protein